MAQGQIWKCARVQKFQTTYLPHETFTGMRMVREENVATFIHVDWIVRSVFLCPTFGENGEFFVNDLLDKDAESDVYLRLKDIQCS